MKLWGSADRKPVLTRDAAKLSALLLDLDDVGRERAAQTISAIVTGIRNLGTLPEEIVDVLWGILVTIARKAVMGADAEKMMDEIEAGLHEDVRALIMDRVRK